MKTSKSSDAAERSANKGGRPRRGGAKSGSPVKYVVDATKHLGLVGQIVGTFLRAPPNVPLEDTQQWSDAILGLLEACRNFDASRGFEFSTYATHCIRNALRTANRLRNADVRKVNNHFLFFSEIESGREHDPDFKHADEVLGLAAREPLDFSSIEIVREGMRLLPERLLRFVHLKFWEGKTLNEIGNAETPRVSRERVRQLLEQAFAIMRRERSAPPQRPHNSQP